MPLVTLGARPIVTAEKPQKNNGVTLVTRNSTDSLRARTRRPSDESHVPKVISMLTSDKVTSNQTYQADAGAHAHAVGLNKSHVTNVTHGFKGLPK